jgi:transcriptional regulator with XRE-family HTH domain
MSRSLSEKIADLPAARRAKIEARAAELVAEEMSLRELRKALGKTQAKLAADLGVGQDSVARYERRTDMLLSTLRGYIHKVGGSLELTARFPNRAPVRITGLEAFAGAARKSSGKVKSPRKTARKAQPARRQPTAPVA